MEKITLRPISKELLFENGEAGTHFDVLAYHGNGPEKNLGSIFVVAHVKHGDEDLGYLTSLVTSIAKREYYSRQSLDEQDSKTAFERVLRKLNETLSDFFNNDQVRLNLGLVAITGDSIYISHLGKFKVALARNGEYVDILNNITLFQKSTDDAKKFSNIISGKIQPGDKIIAYHPARAIVARERQLNDIFLNENQSVFNDKLAQLSSNVETFAYCGVHITMDQIKEIPIMKTAQYGKEVGQIVAASTPVIKKESVASLATRQFLGKSDFSSPAPGMVQRPQPKIIASEVLVSRKSTVLSKLIGYLNILRRVGELSNKKKAIVLAIIAMAVIAPVGIGIYVWSGMPSSEIKTAVRNANNKYKLAQLAIGKSDTRNARELLQSALTEIAGLNDSKTDGIASELSETMNLIDKTGPVEPKLVYEPAQDGGTALGRVIGDENSPIVIDETGAIFIATPNNLTLLGAFSEMPKFVFENAKSIISFDGKDTLKIFSNSSQKISSHTLKETISSKASALYEDNLYLITDAGKILKYAGAGIGSPKRTEWGAMEAESVLSMAVDGTIYVLTADGKIISLYKGKKTGETDIQMNPSPGSKIMTPPESSDSLYVFDPGKKKVFVFNKETKELKISYGIESGEVKDVYITSKDKILVLAGDNKIWKIGN